jgi:hypothetical protein
MLHSACVTCCQVRVLGEASDTFKLIQKDSSKWEVARPPNEVRRAIKSSLAATASSTVTAAGALSIGQAVTAAAALGIGHIVTGAAALRMEHTLTAPAALGMMNAGSKLH